jgi:ankyrin repeat protein
LERPDLEGILPLQYAVLFGNIQMIEILINNKADYNIELEGTPLLHLSLAFTSKQN